MSEREEIIKQVEAILSHRIADADAKTKEADEMYKRVNNLAKLIHSALTDAGYNNLADQIYREIRNIDSSPELKEKGK